MGCLIIEEILFIDYMICLLLIITIFPLAEKVKNAGTETHS